MGSSVNFLPNSPAVATVMDLFSKGFKLLKNARPLSEMSSHTVTSVVEIKPQDVKTVPSRISPLLFAAGAVVAVFITAYIVATKVIPYFFPSSKPTPPQDDLANRTTVIPPPENNRTNGERSPRPVDDDHSSGPGTDDVSDPLTPRSPDSVREAEVIATPNSSNAGSQSTTGKLPPPGSPFTADDLASRTTAIPPTTINSTNGKELPLRSEAEVQPTEPATPSNSNTDEVVATLNSSTAGNQSTTGKLLPSEIPSIAKVDEAPLSSGATRSPNRPRAVSLNSSQTSGSSAVLTSSPAHNEPFSSSKSVQQPTDTSPKRSISSEEDANLSTSSSGDGSPVQKPSPSSSPKPTTYMGQLVGVVNSVFFGDTHFSKWKKYRLIQEQLDQFVKKEKMELYKVDDESSPEEVKIATAWNNLFNAITQPATFKTAKDQYQANVEHLREVVALLRSANPEVRAKLSAQMPAGLISYFRYVGIELFPLLCELIELVTGQSLPANLNIDNFQEELMSRTTALDNASKDHGMSPVAREVNKFKGSANVWFDPLTGSNIPYQDGYLSANFRSTCLLWHGVPVTHHNLSGFIFDMAAGALSYVPFLNRFIPESESVSYPPIINPDYIAFIEEAESQNQKILHVILENGQKKNFGNESPRVKARLNLGVYHPNFYPLALRLDGKFFERHDIHGEESLKDLKQRFKEQLLPNITPIEDPMTASQIETIQSQEQLLATGYCVPQKLREASQLEKHIDTLLDEVHTIYFKGVENITSPEQHQAFLILSYAHIILFICWKMNISILEALCKDDKDRGNVIKTILKLHFLYLTGQFKQETLTAVLVHTLGRPFIIQKNAIIKSRRILIEQVIPFIKEAHKQEPSPTTTVFGGAVHNASYTVSSPPGQTIYPDNASARNLEEYQAFLDNHVPIKLLWTNNLIDEVYQKSGRDLNETNFLEKANAAKTIIKAHNLVLKAEEDNYDEALQSKAINFLTEKAGLSAEGAWKVMCSCHGGLGEKLLDHLKNIFDHSPLGISVKLDEEAPIYIQLNLRTLILTATFNISNGQQLARVKASLTIIDYSKGKAQLEYSLTTI